MCIELNNCNAESGCSRCQLQKAMILLTGQVTNHIGIDCHHLWMPKAPQDDNYDCDQQSHHNDQPLAQRLALAGKKSSSVVTFYAQLMSEHAEDLRCKCKPCATVDLSCPCHTQAKPNMTSNTAINVVMPLNASKCQCHSTITITVIATIIVLCQHTRKTHCDCNKQL